MNMNRKRSAFDRLIDESKTGLVVAIIVIIAIVAVTVIDAITEKRPPTEDPWVGIGQMAK